jgi:type IV secretory pathway VirB9-like protein
MPNVHARLLSRALLCGLTGGLLLAGCATTQSYPPAVPAQTTRVTWEAPPLACYVSRGLFADLGAVRPVSLQPPRGEEWKLWRAQESPKQVCRGKGKRRKCSTVGPDAVAQANRGALVRPTPFNTALGQSAVVRFEVDPKYNRVYEIVTSPLETTLLAFPEGERLASDLLVNEQLWEVKAGRAGVEDAQREVLAIRPLYAPMIGRGVVLLRSGAQILLKLVAQEQPGALSVTFDLPATAIAPPKPTPDQVPPRFDTANAYEGYTLQVEGKARPAWMPEGILDDGHNTLIKFPGLLEGMRVPVVNGIRQDGKPALVQSLLYIRPEHGAWMYIQGLWPALELKDAAQVGVKIVRQPPNPEGKRHAY